MGRCGHTAFLVISKYYLIYFFLQAYDREEGRERQGKREREREEEEEGPGEGRRESMPCSAVRLRRTG